MVTFVDFGRRSFGFWTLCDGSLDCCRLSEFAFPVLITPLVRGRARDETPLERGVARRAPEENLLLGC